MMDYSTIELFGKQISYLDTKELKPCILFIHGNSLSSAVFKKQFEDDQLTNAYRLVALDMLGYGESARAKEPEKDYSLFGQVDLVLAFMEELKLSDVILVGHSFGGNISIECAKKTDKVKGLALLGSPVAENPMSQEMFIPHPALPLFFKPELSDEEIALLSSGLFGKGAFIPEFVEMVIKKSDPLTRAYVMSVIATGAYDDQYVALKEMDIPVASFHGNKDQLVNLAYLQKTIVPRHWKEKVQIVNGGGHMFFYENPNELNAALSQFANDTLNG